MYRGRVTLAAAALFTIGVAFAAQTTSERAERVGDVSRRAMLWTPGTNGVAAAYEPMAEPMLPPL